MKLLIICASLSDQGLAASFRLIHMLNSILDKNIFVTVYLYDTEISECLKKYLNKNQLEVKVVENSGQNNIVSRIVFRLFGIPDSMIFWGLKVEKDILKSIKKYDAILTSSPPHSFQVIGSKLSKKLMIPHFTDFRDDWMGSHRLKHITPLHKLLSKKCEVEVLKNSKMISHAIPFVAKEWKEKYPEYKNKIHTLTNGFPNNILNYKANSKTEIYKKHVIAYFGGSYNNFVVDKINQLRQDLIDFNLSDRWMIITGGPFEIPFKNDEIWIHFGNVPQTEVYDYLYSADIHISLLPPGDLFPSRTIPLKLYTQITTQGACVFIGNDGATTEVFQDIEGVYFLGKNGWDVLGKWIVENETSLIDRNYKRNNINKFNYKLISEKLIDLILENFKQ